ncbi:helix-turn-helix domain-containing protein [Sporohalobacter salinus]|uniref:helix-turn-helix domain-containing protein n=1 Tax=Sporohalobacter salinus TaxID=1494606 RepID=UPI00195F91B6|nr:helix-turn-helix domain-containing protein [Sporohalobacter salinus]MBM7623746.1 excisionase family DNA binding protein [Sporohalobacter salinus]
MGLLESLADRIVGQLETMNERLERLEQRNEYNTDIKMFRVKEIAEKTTLSKTMLYNLIREKKFPCVIVGSRKLVPRKGLIKWINENNVMNQDEKDAAQDWLAKEVKNL